MFVIIFVLFISLITSSLPLIGAAQPIECIDNYKSINIIAPSVISGQHVILRKICAEDEGQYCVAYLNACGVYCDSSNLFYAKCRECVRIFHENLSASVRGEILCYCIWDNELLTGATIIGVNKDQQSELSFWVRNNKSNCAESAVVILSESLWLTIGKFFEIHSKINQILTWVCKSDWDTINILLKIGFVSDSSVYQNFEYECCCFVLRREQFEKNKNAII